MGYKLFSWKEEKGKSSFLAQVRRQKKKSVTAPRTPLENNGTHCNSWNGGVFWAPQITCCDQDFPVPGNPFFQGQDLATGLSPTSLDSPVPRSNDANFHRRHGGSWSPKAAADLFKPHRRHWQSLCCSALIGVPKDQWEGIALRDPGDSGPGDAVCPRRRTCAKKRKRFP